MKKSFLPILGAALCTLVSPIAAHAAGFINGDFETGSFAGWQQAGGTWSNAADGYPTASAIFAGGGAPTNAIVGAGLDSNTGNALRTVFQGNYSARVNNAISNESVSAIRQRVNNYTDSAIAFAYAAVLEDSHGLNDSDAFTIDLTDETTGETLFTYNLNSAAAPGVFTNYGNWYYTLWTPVSIDVSGRSGHDFMLSLLATDCPYGGHAGYAYLDGFGASVEVPEPTTWAMLLGGFFMIGGALRARRRQPATA